MEGEGVVAIVQGLHDAGLAVTVLNRRLHRSRNSHRRPSASKSSVETNTEKSYSNYYYKINKGTNVRDGHYSSSYQIAHCKARPTSPPQSSSEFPPQRLKPSRTEGNFEVGSSHGVWDTLTSPPRAHGSSTGYCDRSIDTGSIYTNRSDKQSHETFAHSLRRYPYSPESSISSELVQKLLSYTQNKYLPKSTSKSQRSLNHERSPQSSKFEVKQSKHIQTYTRTKRDVRTRDCGANTSHDLKFMTNRKGRSDSTFKGNRYKNENNSTSYDYLESPASSQHSPHQSEVRYFRNVKKYIRDTIRQIYNDNPMVCPKMKTRYSNHRRLYHNDQANSQSAEVQATVPTTSKTAFTNYCRPPPGSQSYFPKIASMSDTLRCRCKKPRLCICNIKAEKAAALVRQQVADWVNDLPIFTENTEENKHIKEEIIKNLQDIISKVPKDENYDENIKKEINTFVESLPIWHAFDDDDDEVYKNEIIDALLDKLKTTEERMSTAVKDLVRKRLDDIEFDRNINMDETAEKFATTLTPKLKDDGQLKTKLNELLRNLPIKNKDDVIDDIHNDLLNDLIELSTRSDRPVLTEQELENEINEFLEAYPDLLEIGDKVTNLTRKLKNTQTKPLSESEIERKMKDDVADWMDTLPKSTRDKFSPTEKEEFADDLVDKVQNATNLKATAGRTKASDEPVLTEQELENEINDFLEAYPDILDIGDKGTLAKKLKNTQNTLLDEREKEKKMKDDVADWIDTLPKRTKDKFSPTEKEEFVDDLVNKVRNAKKLKASARRTSATPTSDQTVLTEQELENEINDFLDAYPDILDIGNKATLAKKLKNTQNTLLGEREKEKKMKNDVADWIDTLPKSTRDKFSPTEKEEFVDDLVAKVHNAKKFKASAGPVLTEKELENEINDFLDAYPDILDIGDKATLAKKLKNTQNTLLGEREKEKKMKDDVADWIDTLPKSTRDKFSPTEKEEFVDDLVDKVQNATNLKATAGRTKASDEPVLTEQELENEINDFLDAYPDILDISDKVTLAKKLKNTQSKPLGDREKEQKMKDDVADWIDTLPKSTRDKFSPTEKEEFVDDLVAKVHNAKKFKASAGPVLTEKELENEINDFLDAYPDILDIGNKATLAKKLKNTQNTLLGEREKEKKMKDDVADWIDTLPKSTRDKFSPTEKEEFVDDLVDKVQNATNLKATAGRTKASDEPVLTEQELENEINNFLEAYPDILDIGDKVTLAKKLKNTQTKPLSEREKQQKMKDDVADWIDTLPKRTRDKFSPAEKKEFADDLVDKVQNAKKLKESDGRTKASDEPVLTEQELKNEINDFLDAYPNILDIGDKVTLAKKLKNTQTKPLSEREKQQKMKDDVADWIDTLPKRTRDKFSPTEKEEFVDDLVDKVQNAKKLKASAGPVLTEKELENEINDFLEAYPDILDIGDKVTLAKKLKNTQSKPLGDREKEQKMKDDVADWMNTLPKSTRDKFSPKEKEEFADDLVDKVQNATNLKESEGRTKASDEPILTEQELEIEINDLLDAYPDILDIGDKVTLAKKLKNTQNTLLDEREKEKKMKDDVADWIDTLPKRTRDKFSPAEKKEFADDLVDKVQNAKKLKESDGRTKASDEPVLTEQELKNEINDFLDAYPDILDIGDKVTLAKKLKNTQTKPLSEREKQQKMKDDVADWIDTLPKRTRDKFSPTEKEEFVDDLVDKVQNAKKLKASAGPVLTEKELENEINDFLEAYPDILDIGDKVTLAKKLKNTQSKPLGDREKEQKMKDDVADWMNTLPKSTRDKFSPKEKEEFADDLVDKVQNATNLKESEGRTKASDEPILTEQELEIEINDLLDAYPDILDIGDKVTLAKKLKNTQNTLLDEREKEKKMKDDVADWIDTLPKRTRDKFSPTEKKEFVDNLVDKVQNAKNLKAIANDTKSSLQTQNEIENEIWSLLESMDIDQNDIDESVVKGYALNLKERNKSDFDERDIANDTINFLNELDKSGVLMSKRDQETFHQKVLDKLNKIKDRQSGGGRQPSFVTSTPKKGGARPKNDFNASSFGKGDESNHSISSPSGLKIAEKQYINDLDGEIKSWVETLPLNSDPEKKPKKKMINDLANDIMDRQKYLQIHPQAAKSDAEELEHLKYQVFRWLNRLSKVKEHDIPPVMDKTENLMNKIRNVNIPRLNKSSLRSPSKEKSFGSQSREKRKISPTREQSLMSQVEEKAYGSLIRENTILSPGNQKSFGSASSLKSPSREKTFGSPSREKRTGSPSREKRTGSPSRETRTGSPSAEQSLVSVIRKNKTMSSTGAHSLMSVHSEESAGSLANEKQNLGQTFGSPTGEQNFRSTTGEKNFGSPTRDETLGNETFIPTQNASTFIKENLDGAISDWIKHLPLYDKSSPKQKQKFDNLVSEMSKGIKRVYDGTDNLEQDIDQLVRDEIEKHMGNFPISSEDKDKKTTTQAAAQLLQHLKDQQMFLDISERTDVPYDEYLNKCVDDWANSLSLTHLNSSEKIEFKDLKTELTSKLKKAREDRVDNDTLKSEITKYLKKFPLNDTVRRNKAYKDRKVKELQKALSTLPVAMASRKIPDIHHFVQQAVAKWMQKLPLERGKTLNDIPKDAVENMVNKVSDGLSAEIPLKRVKKTVEDATVTILDQIPLDPKKTHDIKALADDLFEHVKDIPKVSMKGSGSSKENSKDDVPVLTNELKATVGDNLSGAILDWMKQQPDYLDKKAEYDKLISNVAENVKTTLKKSRGEDRDKVLIDEMTKQFKNIPLELKDAGDAKQLIQYLKDLQMLQDNAGTPTQDGVEDVEKNINSYLKNNLNLKRVSLSEKKKFGELKSELSEKLKEMINENADQDALKKKIKYYLSRFPISDDDRKDNQLLDKKAEELLDYLPINENNSPDVYSYVRKGFMKWIKNLPLQKGKNINDIPKQAIDQMARRLSQQIIHSDVVGIGDLKRMLEEETNNFLQITPLDKNVSYDPKKLAKDLFDYIKGTSKGKSKKSSNKATERSTSKSSYKDVAKVSEPRSTGAYSVPTSANVSEPKSSSKDKPTERYTSKFSYKDVTEPRSTGAYSVPTSANASEPRSSSKDKTTERYTSKSSYKDVAKPRSTGAYSVPTSAKVSVPRSSKATNTEASILKSSSDDETTERSTEKSSYEDKTAEVPVSRSNEASVRRPSSKARNTESSIPSSEDETATRPSPKLSYKDKTAKVSVPKSTGASKPTSTKVSGPRSSMARNTDASRAKSSSEDETVTRPTLKLSFIDKEAEASVPRSTGVSEPTSTKVSGPKTSKARNTEVFRPGSSSEDETATRAKIKLSYKDKTGEAFAPRSTGVSEPTSGKVSVSRSFKARNTDTSRPKSSSENETTTRSLPKSSFKDKTAEASVPRPSSKVKTTRATSTETLLSHKSGSMHPSFKSATDQLADNIEQWVNNLPIKENTPEQKSKASNLRRHLSSKIISKVSELNTNPEIFKDDFLYEEMFEDEVDNMITSLSDEDLKRKISAHKKSLTNIVKDGRLKTQEEMAGTAYKQQLRDVVSKNVPSEYLNENENASFEVLKEDVADAFVSLHYVRGEKGDAESKARFKNNVKSEIDEFCAEYLKHHPKTAVDAEKLKSDLYKALKDVPVPNDEAIKQEIDIIKIKELINQWIDKIKLLGGQTDVDRLKTKKKISVLAKKLHEIEKMKESNPDCNSNDMMKKEITKWLQKMPVVITNDLDEIAEQLIEQHKNTEELRKSLRSYSSGKESTMPTSSYSNGPWSTMDSDSPPRGSSGARFSSSPKPEASSKISRRSVGNISTVPEVSEPTTESAETSTSPEFTIVPSFCAPPCAIPPSTLSPEDREYLKKIRERATQSMKQSSPKTKEAAASPIVVDDGSQTEITTPQAQSTPLQTKTPSQTSEVEASKPEMQATGSQVEVLPNVIVKEYYWDSIDSKLSPCSKNLTCSKTPCPQMQMPCSSRPSYICPRRTSQHAQTAPSLRDCDPLYPYFLPDLPRPCKSRRSKQSNRGSNRNLVWSKEDVYGDRREPSDEEEIITGRRRKHTCRCKDKGTNSGTKKRECKTCKTNDDSLKKCPKCCGVHCPLPSYLYFNNDRF